MVVHKRGVDAWIVCHGCALEEYVPAGAVSPGCALGDGGIKLIQCPKIIAGADIDGGIDQFDFVLGNGILPIELLFVGEFVERLVEAFWAAVDDG